MTPNHQDGRPRVFINAQPNGAEWKRHPAGQGQHAATPGAALDAAIAELGDAPAVIIWSGRPMAPP